MLSRNIYIVRHGETVLNKNKIRQNDLGSLSEDGVLQAHQVGLRLKNFNIKKIFCSPFQRAKETYLEINDILNIKNVEYTALLSERKNPSKIIGLKYDDPLTVEAINFMDKSFHVEDARWQDEENFEDLKSRALKLQKFLASNSVDGTLCITHGIFLKMFLCVVIFGEKLSVKDYIKLSVFNPADNAGITILKYKPLKFFSNPWEIVAYNDTPININNLRI